MTAVSVGGMPFFSSLPATNETSAPFGVVDLNAASDDGGGDASRKVVIAISVCVAVTAIVACSILVILFAQQCTGFRLWLLRMCCGGFAGGGDGVDGGGTGADGRLRVPSESPAADGDVGAALGSDMLPVGDAASAAESDDLDRQRWALCMDALECLRHCKLLDAAVLFNNSRGHPAHDCFGEALAVSKAAEVTGMSHDQARAMYGKQKEQVLRQREGWPPDWGLPCFGISYKGEKQAKYTAFGSAGCRQPNEALALRSSRSAAS
eukprot:Rhum_TRINITY_DN3316_c0_g1::Rhum_TRINITY_DN3316_c0_g1_i1::g.10303::m.10303